MTKHVALRRLAEGDLATLHSWLDAGHLRPFYTSGPVARSDVEDEFSPRLGDGHAVRCLVAATDAGPFGYIQWYLNAAYPTYGAATAGHTDGVSFDYFIGSAAHLGKGLGTAILRGAVAHVAPQVSAQDRRFYVWHDDRNIAAIRCATSAGFRKSAELETKGWPGWLYTRGPA